LSLVYPPDNTPVLPLRKPDDSSQLVQDPRATNQIVQRKYPVFCNPYTLLSKVLHDHKWFSMVNLKDTFLACPLEKESRDLFVFGWDDPTTVRKQQYRWAVVLQGFTESTNLFGQILEQVLEKFESPSQIRLLQYVHDLLVSATMGFPNFL
jgi:hypothetical protein